MKKLKVVELFAGVGGFRLGLDKASNKHVTYQVVWSNQWEPNRKTQHASNIYVKRFGRQGHSNEDIEKVLAENFDEIPNHDLLVGGFPCQDYSVAKTLSRSHGLIGEKGVLWWSIYTILQRKGKDAPDYLMLENVDRLLKSPSKQRGRDFAIMLASLSDLGYAVEWRVINAAEYGFPQRRRRVFIMGYKKGTPLYKKIQESADDISRFLTDDGVIANAFPVMHNEGQTHEYTIVGSLAQVSEDFSMQSPKKSPFENSGVMIDRNVCTMKVSPVYSGERQVMSDVLIEEKDVPEQFFISKDALDKWRYLKGGKKAERKTKDGHVYFYSEGSMIFPDPLDKPSRTIITGEGGVTPSRFKHVVKTPSGRLRRLTPLELERLDMFPDNHTELEGVSDTMRAFIAGNALVVGVIERLGKALLMHM